MHISCGFVFIDTRNISENRVLFLKSQQNFADKVRERDLVGKKRRGEAWGHALNIILRIKYISIAQTESGERWECSSAEMIEISTCYTLLAFEHGESKPRKKLQGKLNWNGTLFSFNLGCSLMLIWTEIPVFLGKNHWVLFQGLLKITWQITDGNKESVFSKLSTKSQYQNGKVFLLTISFNTLEQQVDHLISQAEVKALLMGGSLWVTGSECRSNTKRGKRCWTKIRVKGAEAKEEQNPSTKNSGNIWRVIQAKKIEHIWQVSQKATMRFQLKSAECRGNKGLNKANGKCIH